MFKVKKEMSLVFVLFFFFFLTIAIFTDVLCYCY